jgi:hypothetical protein
MAQTTAKAIDDTTPSAYASEARWPRLLSLAFAVGASLTLWAVIIGVVAWLV